MPPRFSVVIPVRDRADTVGRTVAAVLTQTFGDLEVVVVDDGSTDDTVAAARAPGDERLRVVRQGPAGATAACRAGLAAAAGRWAVLVDADTEVAPGWLARLGRLADATGADFLSCGGEHRHLDGSATEVLPGGVACLRPGAFAADRALLATASVRVAAASGLGTDGTDGADDAVGAISAVGRAALVSVMADDRPARAGSEADGAPPAAPSPPLPTVVHTPERLVLWHDPVPADIPPGDELRLHWAWQVLDALSRTPIPDGDLLARAATVGGVAAARLGRHDRARLLFGIAARTQPGVARHWARWAVSSVPVVSRRVWGPDGAVGPVVTGDPAVPAGAAG